jgi:predicted RNA binding protein YcfA (HicA-like mRNA interferase family)
MHGAKDFKPGTLRDIIADMGLTVDEFVALL